MYVNYKYDYPIKRKMQSSAPLSRFQLLKKYKINYLHFYVIIFFKRNFFLHTFLYGKFNDIKIVLTIRFYNLRFCVQ